MFVLCQGVLSPCAIIPGLSLLQRTRPGVLPYRPRAPREAARVHRVRVDCLASSSPEKAGGVTGSLWQAGTKGNGHCGGFTRRAVEAWHVQCRHALRSGAFDNVRSHRFCILLGSAQFQSVRGHLEAPQCVASMLLEQRVLSPPGNLYVPGVKKRAAGFYHLRLGLGERHQRHQ